MRNNLMRLLGRKNNMRGWKKMWGTNVSEHSSAKNKEIWDWIVWI